MVSVYDFTCVDQQLHKLTVGHQELGDQVDVPVSKNDEMIDEMKSFDIASYLPLP